jgi:hypothetical protein
MDLLNQYGQGTNIDQKALAIIFGENFVQCRRNATPSFVLRAETKEGSHAGRAADLLLPRQHAIDRLFPHRCERVAASAGDGHAGTGAGCPKLEQRRCRTKKLTLRATLTPHRFFAPACEPSAAAILATQGPSALALARLENPVAPVH